MKTNVVFYYKINGKAVRRDEFIDWDDREIPKVGDLVRSKCGNYDGKVTGRWWYLSTGTVDVHVRAKKNW